MGRVDINENILNAVKHRNWDVYRKHFHNLSIKDQIQLNYEWDKRYPKQAHFSIKPITACFTNATTKFKNFSVVELGCHQGYLAKQILEHFDSINSWIGYDINSQALERSVVKDKRYTNIALKDWFHNTTIPNFDLFISTHTFEHMDLDGVDKTIASISRIAKYMILEIPIQEYERHWRGYKGGHVLRSGRPEIRSLIEKYGFSQISESTRKYWVSEWSS